MTLMNRDKNFRWTAINNFLAYKDKESFYKYVKYITNLWCAKK